MERNQLLSGQKLELLDKWSDEHKKKYRRSLLTENELRSLSVTSLYVLSLKGAEYRINKIFKKYNGGRNDQLTFSLRSK